VLATAGSFAIQHLDQRSILGVGQKKPMIFADSALSNRSMVTPAGSEFAGNIDAVN
jgi:hypothetical protein